jgi:chromosome partitioning protein
MTIIPFKRVIPVFSALIQKGGAGKTTLNFTFAEYCSLIMGKRVLVIDLDPQCNMSTTFLEMDREDGWFVPPIHPDFDPSDPFDVENFNPRSSITDIYEGKLVIPYGTYITPNEKTGSTGMLDIIPGHQQKLTDVGNYFTSGSLSSDPKSAHPHYSYVDFAFRLSDFLGSEDIAERYDIVVLDAGPTDNLFFRAVIYAASYVICPYTPDDYSLNGIATLLNVAKDPKRKSRGFNSLNFLGIMPSAIIGTSPSHQLIVKRNIELYGDVHLPIEIFMKRSDQLVGRKSDVLGSENKEHSIFKDAKSSANRKHFEKVMSYLYRQVFAKELS